MLFQRGLRVNDELVTVAEIKNTFKEKPGGKFIGKFKVKQTVIQHLSFVHCVAVVDVF